jgi:hypothetical protein
MGRIAYGASRFSRIPTASNSLSRSCRCSARFVASRIITIISLVCSRYQFVNEVIYRGNLTFAAEMTCRPLPFPSEAPSMIPGKSRTWISAPPYSNTPGIAVRVVKAYAATMDLVFVILDKKVDFPTEGNPTSAIRASPLLLTSKPVPPLDPAPAAGSSSCARNRASFLDVS